MASCQGPFEAFEVDAARNCVVTDAPIVRDCKLGTFGGSLLVSCYRFETPDGSSVVVRTPTNWPEATYDARFIPCDEDLRGEVDLLSPCD
jgi:hypothetical protein